jgi:hypothetical protein
VVTVGTLRVGVIGLSAQPGQKDVYGPEGKPLIWKDPVMATRDALQSLPTDLDLIVALSNLDEEENRQVAEEFDSISLLLSTRGKDLDDPRSITTDEPGGGLLWVETPDRGRYLQLIRLRLGSNAAQRPVQSPPLQDWRDLRTTRAQRLRQQQEGNPSNEALHSTEQLFAEIGRGRNLALVDTIPLAKDLDGVSSLTPRVDEFKADTLVEAARVAAEPPPPLQPAYASSGACVNCHPQEFIRWSYSAHSRAYEALIKEGQEENPECISCHSTGFAQPGGFGSIERTHIRKFKAVQCEACHGPLKGHPDDPRVDALTIDADRCMTCHDPANSPDFDFPGYLWTATCQSHEGLSPPSPVVEE